MKGITWPGYKGEPRRVLGVPGVYAPGVVVPLKDLGLSVSEAQRLTKNTPLEVVDLEPPKTAKKAKDKEA